MPKERVVYVGSSHHLTITGSTVFFVELLREKFTVDLLVTDDWTETVYPDLTYIDTTYVAVIFFQTVPLRVAKSIRCRNLVFVPMFDQSGSDPFDEWMKYHQFLIICFSTMLFKRLSGYGLTAITAQYFPEPQTVTSPIAGSVFFWQRSPELDWAVVERVIPTAYLRKVHLHANQNSAAVLNQLKRSNPRCEVVVTDWFSSKDQYFASLATCELFIAPRGAEGIGLSFLEAMANGLVVVAVNYPTMNEYIMNGVTGFLYDLDNPQPIELFDLAKIREHTIEYMNDGYRRWTMERLNILDEISKQAGQRKHFTVANIVLAAGIRMLRRIKKFVMKRLK
jgi:hypothetical protein